MMENLNKVSTIGARRCPADRQNLVDQDEYPSATEIHNRCIVGVTAYAVKF